MRSLLIQYPDDFAIIAPVKRHFLAQFEILLNYLQEQWQINGQITERVLQISSRLSPLFPRLDKPGEFGFDTRSLEQSQFESLFIAQVVNGVIVPCRLLELHSFKAEGRQSPQTPPPPQGAVSRRQKAEGENLTPADIPIKSSGIPDADLFASLVTMDNTVEGAWRMWTQFDAEFINGAISYLNELRRDPQERMNEYLKARFDEWKQQNRQSYYKNLGVD